MKRMIFIVVLLSGGTGTYGQEQSPIKWQSVSGKNFDVYYYDSGQDIAEQALDYIENEFHRISDLTGYPPDFKTKIFLYSALADLRQQKVELNKRTPTGEGENHFAKPYVEVPYNGTRFDFKEDLLLKVSQLMVNEMMFGGSLHDIFNETQMELPDWFGNGAALYVSKGWSVEMDDYVRELMKTRKHKNISRLSGMQAALAGQSVWNYIVEKYGNRKVSNILNYTRVTRNEEKSLEIALGVSYKQLMSDWRQYYSGFNDQAGRSGGFLHLAGK